MEQDIIGPQLPCLNVQRNVFSCCSKKTKTNYFIECFVLQEDDSFITRCKADIEARAKEKKLKLTTHEVIPYDQFFMMLNMFL